MKLFLPKLKLPLVLIVALLVHVFCVEAAHGQYARKQPAKRGRVPAHRKTPVESQTVKVRIARGDNLESLAERFGVSIDQIAHANGISFTARLKPGSFVRIPINDSGAGERQFDTNRLRLENGTHFEFDEIWEDAQGVWYRSGGVTQLVERSRVSSIERKAKSQEPVLAEDSRTIKATVVDETIDEATPVWIYLVGGARVEVEEIREEQEGVWYTRGKLSVFLERSRIERIEKEVASDKSVDGRARGWSTGSARLDHLIKHNGNRFGVDPYLIFCVIEQESQFRVRALSPKGAQGLMQLMPGTASRFGVRRPFDPAENIMGGTRYLKQLLNQFGGRIDLALAGYNAGEGAVLKYGRRVPPYAETRHYVKKISRRYGQGTTNSTRMK